MREDIRETILKMKFLKITLLLAILAFALGGCATLSNGSATPVTIWLSDGTEGVCRFINEHMDQSFYVPGTVMVPRSDEDLMIVCESISGKIGQVILASEIDTAKMTTSLLLDPSGGMALIDYITDAHRYYPDMWVVPVSGRLLSIKK